MTAAAKKARSAAAGAAAIDQAVRRLDLNVLLILDSALRHRKLSAVAAELALSQPAISHAIARLREVFRDDLFIRRPHGMEPTRRAVEIGPRVAQIIRLARDTVSEPHQFAPRESHRTFRLAGLDLEMAAFGPIAIRILTEQAPLAKLSFQPLTRGDAIRALEEGSIDLAFGHFLQAQTDIAMMPLYTENYKVAVSAENKAIGRKLTLDTYCDKLTHILVSLDGAFSGTLDNALQARGRRRTVVATVPSFFPALATAAKTGAAVTMPSRLIEAYGPPLGLRVFAPPLPVRSFEVMMAWHRRNDAEPGLSWFRAEIVRGMKELL